MLRKVQWWWTSGAGARVPSVYHHWLKSQGMLYWSAFLLPGLNIWHPKLKGEEVYFGSQLQRRQSMVGWVQGRKIMAVQIMASGKQSTEKSTSEEGAGTRCHPQGCTNTAHLDIPGNLLYWSPWQLSNQSSWRTRRTITNLSWGSDFKPNYQPVTFCCH